MKRLAFFVIIFACVFVLCAELNNPVLAIQTADDQLIYDQEKGILYDGDEIYLTLFRSITVNEILTYTLVCVHSSNNGNNYSETVIEEFEMIESDAGLLLERKYAPVITNAETGNILIFFTNPVTTHPQTAVSSDNGNTFIMGDIADLVNRSQFQILKNEEDITFAAIENDFEMPLSLFQYFTKNEFSENDEYALMDRVKFWGPDVYWGRVHSNDNIWIAQLGGGTNNNWPTFHGLVTTHGLIMDHATGQPADVTAPMDQVFQGGYQENASELTLPSIAENVRENGIILEESLEHDILFVQIEGNTAHLRYADWTFEPASFTVYNSFPDAAHPNTPVGDSIWTNEINVKELVWSDDTEDIEVIDTSVFVNCQLWIKGVVGSNMTWASADTVYITGDIYYDDIELGDPAENSEYIFGLLSEERIYIKYKYRDHLGEIHSNNCHDIYLYGCYAAIGDGDIDLYGNMNTHYEGIITFEYQHPHGSTPGFTYILPGGEEWQILYPDFHKYIYPITSMWTGDPGFFLHGGPIAPNPWPTCGYPYEDPDYPNPAVTPYGTDYPWYNPVWPEGANPAMGERGIIHLNGSMQQRRRGFVHRSGSDPLNHSDNEWDIEHWNYSGTHDSAGYDKDYHYDERLLETFPVDYPKITIENMSCNTFTSSSDISLYDYNNETGEVTVISTYTLPSNKFQLIDLCRQDGEYMILLTEDPADLSQEFILRYNGIDWSLTALSMNFINPESIDNINDLFMIKADNELYVFDRDGNLQTDWFFNSFSLYDDFTNIQGNVLHYLIQGDDNCLYRTSELVSSQVYTILGEFEFSFEGLDELEFPNLNILHNPDGKIVMQIMDSDTDATFTYKNIYLAIGDISEFFTSAPEDEITIVPELKAYPNPFNPVVNLSFGVNQAGLVEIDIYNIKGQKVENLISEYYETGKHQLNWQAPQSGSGIYFVQYKLNGIVIENKRLTLLK
ncbi:MAG: T9SS type A sorting domain-containing protein [Candidatus Cloacimonetes bacterium]|nr:T9SS type A sorting domain-containing protein [Candidatus Cloacimonadota bacterium]